MAWLFESVKKPQDETCDVLTAKDTFLIGYWVWIAVQMILLLNR